MVRMQDVTKIYDSSGTVALDGVDLTINEGEFVFLVGPSGSGKTTLMKLITGEVRATAGEIVVNDFDMMKIKRRKLSKVRRTLGHPRWSSPPPCWMDTTGSSALAVL